MPNSPRALQPALDADVEALETASAGRLSYYVDRSGSGRPLVLLHSMNAAPSAIEVKPLFEHYRGHRPVIAPDLPGFGLSDRLDIDYTPALYADVIAELLQAVAATPADLVALSTTAEFAARCALDHAEAIRSLTVVSPTGLGKRAPPGPVAQARIKRVLNSALFGRGFFNLVTSGPSIRFFLNKAFYGSAPVEMTDYARATARQPGAEHAPFCFLCGGLFTADALSRLYAKVAVPGLVLYDEDPNVSFEQLPRLLEAGATWQAKRISPTRGLPHWEQLADTVATLEAFWRGIDE